MGENTIDLSQFTQEEIKKILEVAALFESKSSTSDDAPVVETPQPKSTNWFETSDVFDMHKDDSIVDRKLWKNKTPEPRNIHGSGMITIECRNCHKEYTISEKLLPPDKDRFTCDKCIKSSRPGSND